MCVHTCRDGDMLGMGQAVRSAFVPPYFWLLAPSLASGCYVLAQCGEGPRDCFRSQHSCWILAHSQG